MRNENGSAESRQTAIKETRVYEHINNAPLPVLRMDSNGVIFWVNNALCDLLCFNPEDMIRRNICDFYFDPALCLGLLRQIKSEASVRNHQSVLRCSTGEAKTVLINANFYYEDDGTEKYVRCFLTDITERSEPHMIIKNLVAAPPTGIYVIDADGCITFFNETAERLFGFSPGINNKEFKYFPFSKACNTDGTLIDIKENPVMLGLASAVSFRNCELIIERYDNSCFNALISMDVLTDEEGKSGGAIVLIQEIKNKRRS